MYVSMYVWMYVCTSKKCTKKRDERAELLFWFKPIVFDAVVVVVVARGLPLPSL